jgi:hypothetical protein
MAELDVHVVKQNIIVRQPGTLFAIAFRKYPESPNLFELPEWTQADLREAVWHSSERTPGRLRIKRPENSAGLIKRRLA